MKVYKIIFLDECDRPWEVFEHIEIVKSTELARFVHTMVKMGRICDENVEIFKEKHPYGLQTQTDAVELLELDGYKVESVEI